MSSKGIFPPGTTKLSTIIERWEGLENGDLNRNGLEIAKCVSFSAYYC